MRTLTENRNERAKSPYVAEAWAEFRAFWRTFFARAFDPYRPEHHYMRGPGPAWREKNLSRNR